MAKNCENSIREAAYYLWQNAGSPTGQDEYFWALAINEVNGSCSKKASTSKSLSSTKKSSVSTTKSTAKKASASTTKKSK